jgi:DSF synthase
MMQNLAVSEALQDTIAHNGNDNCTSVQARTPLNRSILDGVQRSQIARHWHRGRPHWLALANQLQELELTYDSEKRILWQYMMPDGRPSYTSGMLRDMNVALDMVEQAAAETKEGDELPVRYLVLGSHIPGIFNLGGDLPLFMTLIEQGDHGGLRRYAHACIDVQYRRAVNLELPICTIAVVQGDALGGGFEAALAHDVIIAERSAKFGLPEVLFNLFPGMGAYSFLSRRLDAMRAERMILSGRIYSADELHEMGVVDMVVDDGRGTDGVLDYVARFERARPSRQAVLNVRQIINPVSRQELIDITDLWVDTALTLGPADLRKMRHLATAQNRRWAKIWAH